MMPVVSAVCRQIHQLLSYIEKLLTVIKLECDTKFPVLPVIRSGGT